MSATTKIQWCDSTLNFWSGCTKVSAGCANCYAEALSHRKLGHIGQWGKGAPRQLHESAFQQALALNRKPWVCDGCGRAADGNLRCDACGNQPLHRRRIFALSLGDWLDPEVPVEWLARMLDTVRQCDQVTWILCTKRPELWFERMKAVLEHNAAGTGDTLDLTIWIARWLDGAPHNLGGHRHIILLASVENQAMADERIPALLRIPAAFRGLSLEPLLGPVVLPQCNGRHDCPLGNAEGHSDLPFGGISWLILGGESGPSARPCNVDWIRALVAQGKLAGVATFVKQLGANPHRRGGEDESETRMMLDDKKGGDPAEWPADLQVRQFPPPPQPE